MNERKDNILDISEYISTMVYVVRDCNLPENIEKKYIPGMIIREKEFCDATYIIGGMVTTHRFTILSNQFYDLSSFSNEQKGLCTTNREARFKILDKFSANGKTQITLLELPRDERWKNFLNITYITEKMMAKDAREKFLTLSTISPLPEQNSQDMLDKFYKPIGINEEGVFYPVE